MSTSGRPRAVLFDVDGTLVDSNYLHVEAWHHAFERLGVAADAWRIHRAIGQDSARLITMVAGERDEAWIERAKGLHSDFYRDLASRLRPFDGSRELLAAVADRGIRVVLATSAPRDELELLLEALDAGDAIHATTSADDVETAKPDPAIIGVALQRAGAAPSEAVFVGDSTWDMIAAGRAGVTAYGLRSGGIPDVELTDAGARAVFDDPGDLHANLDEIVGG
ncbi:HAD family hydrolase [Agromyces albus]|uniref:HAD family hydrolase n=1 Tax=Agromyces albus TaxID=205332 RepID=A0A4Q2L0B8_9MICO|nr:HAD family hydrolase [Agromyces albus]RXZ71445.1 HAD family hydrolase [Agromyces albus]